MSKGFKITAVSKLKNGPLWECVKKMGTQAALSRYLNVPQVQLGGWVNLRKCPTFRNWDKKRVDALERKLFDLCGKTLDEIFPQDLRDAKQFLSLNKTFEQSRDMGLLLNYEDRTKERLLLPSPVEAAEQHEEFQTTRQWVESLKEQERQVIKMRYGFESPSMNLEETANALGLSKTRITQIERKAIKLIRQQFVPESEEARRHKHFMELQDLADKTRAEKIKSKEASALKDTEIDAVFNKQSRKVERAE